MKINYEMSSKECISYVNLTTGFLKEKHKWKKEKNLKTFASIFICNLLLCLLFIPLIGFFDTFNHFDFVTSFFAICLLAFLGVQIFQVILFFINVIQERKRNLKGVLKIDEQGITQISENANEIFRKWSEIQNILIHDNVILIITKHGMNFLLPNYDDTEKKLREELEKQKKSKLIVDVYTAHGFTYLFQVFGKPLLLFFIFMGISVFWDYYNISLIDNEVWKINNSGYEEIDEHIHSYQKFGVIEKTLKEYFKEFFYSKQTYYNHKADAIFRKVTIDLLKNHPEEIGTLLNSLSKEEQMATQAGLNIISLLDESIVMERIKAKNLGFNYEETFKDYALTEDDAVHAKSWQKEIEDNQTKMGYVKKALQILNDHPDCWYVEDDTFYVCDDYLEEYNTLYDLILNQKSSENQTV